jgi:putative PIN family toxin of toxin-antitoxin system
VVVSAHLSDEGYPSFVVDLCLSSRLQWCVSPEILDEYAEVLHRKRLRIDAKLVDTSLGLIRKQAKLVKPRERLAVCSDPDDDRFLECALEAGADYLVTGNKRHFPTRYSKTQVVSPRELIEIIITELKK